MYTQDLEPEMEALLERLAPGASTQWRGVSEDEIARVEELAGRPLPRFYRWFLARMGASMGPFTYPSIDFSAVTVLRCYAEGLFRPRSRFFMIGYESDEMMPLHILYDFDHPARDDARVVKRHSLGGDAHTLFETFREQLAWGEVLSCGIDARPFRATGGLRDSDLDVLAHLDPAMQSLGFHAPVATGSRCSVYFRSDAAMVTRASIGIEPGYHIFHLGANDEAQLRRILGEISANTQLEIDRHKW